MGETDRTEVCVTQQRQFASLHHAHPAGWLAGSFRSRIHTRLANKHTVKAAAAPLERAGTGFLSASGEAAALCCIVQPGKPVR